MKPLPLPQRRSELLAWATDRCLRGPWRRRHLLVSEDDQLDPELAVALAADRSVVVRRAVAHRSDAPRPILERLAEDPDRQVRLSAGRGLERLPAAGATTSSGSGEAAATTTGAPDPVPGTMLPDLREARRLARETTLSAEAAQRLFSQHPDDATLAWLLLDQRALSGATISAIASRVYDAAPERQGERCARIAEHPNTPAEVLAAMIERRTAWADRAAGHPGAAPDTVEVFLERFPHADWRPVAKRSDLRAEQISRIGERFLRPADWRMLSQLVRRPAAPAAFLERVGALVAYRLDTGPFALPARAIVVPALVANPVTPDAALEALHFQALPERHRAMVLERLLCSDAAAEVAGRLWEDLSGTCGEVVALLSAVAGGTGG